MRMNADRRPSAAFGHRGAGTQPSATRAHAAPAGGIVPIAGVALLTFLLAMVVFAAIRMLPAIGGANAESARATARVIEIVNQPVTHLRLSGPVAMFSPGWFHAGAQKPDFDTVDIRATQELLYSGASHVSSDLNPTEMFIGGELEFNAMTKYFYADRTLPKHRLSDSEMDEINGLYRVIGRDARASSTQILMIAGLAAAALCLGVGLYYLSGRAFGDSAA